MSGKEKRDRLFSEAGVSDLDMSDWREVEFKEMIHKIKMTAHGRAMPRDVAVSIAIEKHRIRSIESLSGPTARARTRAVDQELQLEPLPIRPEN